MVSVSVCGVGCVEGDACVVGLCVEDVSEGEVCMVYVRVSRLCEECIEDVRGGVEVRGAFT